MEVVDTGIKDYAERLPVWWHEIVRIKMMIFKEWCQTKDDVRQEII
jgi:hypothetical protein